MLFLVKVELSGVPSNEIARVLELIEEEWQVVDGMIGEGQVRACGKLATRPGAVAIFDLPSEAAVKEAVARLPLAPYFGTVEIERLIPADQALRTAQRRRHAFESFVSRRGEDAGKRSREHAAAARPAP
jgi:muconolactone D-isomerase